MERAAVPEAHIAADIFPASAKSLANIRNCNCPIFGPLITLLVFTRLAPESVAACASSFNCVTAAAARPLTGFEIIVVNTFTLISFNFLFY
jgi:hypothetical protein